MILRAIFIGAPQQGHSGTLDLIGSSKAPSKPSTVYKLDRNPVASKSNRAQQSNDLGARQDLRQHVMVFGADLAEDRPILACEHLAVKEPATGGALADRFWLPVLFGFNEEEIVPDLSLCNGGWISLEMLVDQPHCAVVAMLGANRIITQREHLGEFTHRRVRMLVSKRVRPAVGGTGPASLGARELPFRSQGALTLIFIMV
jgi:hypothetical protein